MCLITRISYPLRAFCVFTCVFFCTFANAQVMNRTHFAEALNRDYTLAERFSYRTNVLEWLLTIPNVGIEFDLSSSQYNRHTIGLEAKYNWNTYQRYAPSTVFDMFDIRPEYRYYYRHTQRAPRAASDTARLGFARWWNERFWTTARKNPRPWRANYIGAYMDYSQYSFKFGGAPGLQGQSVGFGLSWGYDVPRYQYRKCAIDVEVGFSVGLAVTRYTAYSHTTDGYYYVPLPEKSKNWHLTPFPVVSEVKLAFVLRPVSIESKYINEDPLLKKYLLAKRDVEYPFSENGSINKTRFDESHEAELDQFRKDRKAYRDAFREYMDSEAKSAVDNAVSGLNDEGCRKKLQNYVNSLKFKAMVVFESAVSKELRNNEAQRRKEDRQVKKAEKQTEKQARKQAGKSAEPKIDNKGEGGDA